MDESGSVSDKDFVKEKDFVAQLAGGFSNFGPDGVQMGVITFSTRAKLDIPLQKYANKMDFMKDVTTIKQEGNSNLWL